MYVLRTGPQLRVDAFSIMMLLTPTASAASLGYAGLQAARRNTRFARYCEEIALADASILLTN